MRMRAEAAPGRPRSAIVFGMVLGVLQGALGAALLSVSDSSHLEIQTYKGWIEN